MVEELEIGVPEFFAGQTLFLTGGTGFMGKVLIDKLLRSCPEIRKIYVLVRPKKGKKLRDRLESIFENVLFDKLKKEQPNAFQEKVIPVSGDVVELGLGLSEEDREMLKENVTLVYHVAASVRFDQPLKDAIMMNTRGTREICNLALEMKNLKVFTHISTAYCHTDQKVIEEKMYPPHADWRKTIEIAEKMDTVEFNSFTHLYVKNFPNTYTFTKSLAEGVVHDLLNGKVSNVIVRPTIVVSSYKEPMPGWTDNFNGPVAFMSGWCTGILRIYLLSLDVCTSYVVVDMAIKTIILASWRQAVDKLEDRNETKVYNCNTVSMPLKNLIELAPDCMANMPLTNCIWYPSTATTKSLTFYHIYFFLYQLLPAIFIDFFLKLFKKRPIMYKLQRKIYTSTMALKFFLLNDWDILNGEMLFLEKLLPKKDVEDFGYAFEGFVVDEVYVSAYVGAKKWLFHESVDNVEAEKRRMRILYYLDRFVKFAFFAVLTYYIFVYNVPKIFFDSLYNYVYFL